MPQNFIPILMAIHPLSVELSKEAESPTTVQRTDGLEKPGPVALWEPGRESHVQHMYIDTTVMDSEKHFF